NLKDQIKKLKEACEKAQASNPLIEKLKEMNDDLKEDISKHKLKYQSLQEENKKLKNDLAEKENEMNDLQKRITRLNTERNGYKNILELYESSDKKENSEIDLLKSKNAELERIIEEYKKDLNEKNELKLGNNTAFQLNKDRYSSIEVQVNLTGEIYSTYESKIEVLNSELNEARERYTKLEDKVLQGMEITGEDLVHAKSEETQVLEIKLKEQISMNQKQIAEFKKKALEITRSIRCLLGFKVNFEDKTVKLTSQKNPEDYVLFRVNPDHSLSLMSSDFVKPYKEFIDLFIKKYNSISGFLAAIHFDSLGLNLQLTNKM
ncbi:unnamed protein product, partial [Brachionus calyciflorus]